MMSDIGRTESFYSGLSIRIDQLRQSIGHPLTLSEKILYNHLFDRHVMTSCRRGVDYADFAPDRVAMQDATAQMALLQFMVTGKDRSFVPASVHCDHLIVAASGAEKDLDSALNSNREVYEFLRSACAKYSIDFWEAGSGIIHQIILENYAFPGGMMIGTDSHTPNAGGIGMLAVGVGGADAVDVMAGMSWELKFPEIIGIKLTGKLSGWTSAKDVILKIAGLLTVKGGTGRIIEYFGPGAESLSCTGKATICNMGAETGATSSVFGFDESMAEYLVATGRKEIARMAEGNREHLIADPEIYAHPEKYFDHCFEINLSGLEPYINGPFTPDRAIPISMMKAEARKNKWPEEVEVALIGSCTNSSYEDISRAASVARNALAENIVARSEFTVTPGSEQIQIIAERDGFLDLFRKIGGKIYANACGPCIGQWHRKGADEMKVNTIIHSFNRNFSGRTDGNPNTHAFVASPEIVTAIAIAGKITFNPLTDTVDTPEGRKVKIPEPEGFSLPPKRYAPRGKESIKPLADLKDTGIIISPDSERLQILSPFSEWNGEDFINLPLLIKAKGKCTTDHISMAGPWLKYRGHLENISANYMIGALNYFNDKTNSVLNQLTGEYEPVPVIAGSYRDRGLGSVVVGEENFGEGSSREHAAMEPRFLGVKAVIVKSFARIHETNLKKQGVLTLTFSDVNDYNKIREDDRIDILGLHDFAPGKQFTVRLNHKNGTSEVFPAFHSYNETQIAWFKAGSALNLIRKEVGDDT